MLLDPPQFLLVHVCLSLVGMIAGLVVLGGLMGGMLLRRWISLFIISTALTSLTGFGFPFVQLLPSHIVGAVSLVALLGAAVALYWRHLRAGWRTAFVVFSTLALYANVFVLLAQLFQKIPPLAMLAPTPSAPAFAITQALALALFAGTGWAAARNFAELNSEYRNG
jgi:hypothetical protein